MILGNKKIVLLISVFLLLYFTYQYNLIRRINYRLIPNPGVLDELDYAWQGMSLRQTGVPVAWSTFFGYIAQDKINTLGVLIKGFTIQEGGETITPSNLHKFPLPVMAVQTIDYGQGDRYLGFIAPFFDHPPLGGLIFSLGISQKAKTFADVNFEQTRSVAVTTAILTTILIFILTTLIVKNPLTGLLASLIYSTVPSYMLGSRFAFLENLAAPFVLLYLILLYLFWQLRSKYSKISWILLVLAGLVAGLSLIVKESSLGFVIGSLVVLYLLRVPKKAFIVFLSLVTLPSLGYVGWGLYLSPRIFWQVFFNNSTRGFYGSLNFISIVPALRFPNFPLDGWWIWGLLSFLFLSFQKNSKYLFILLPTLGHLLIILLFAGANYPWYFLTLMPFMAIFSSLVIFDLLIEPLPAVALSFLLLPLSSSFYWGHSVFNQPPKVLEYRLLVISFVVILLLRLFKPNNKIIAGVWMVYIVVVTILSIKWNSQSLTYIFAHWGNLPIPSLPSI